MIMRLLIIAVLATSTVFAQTPIDKSASKKTRYLLGNLKRVSDLGVMFGHQDDQAYGVGWRNEDNRSDVLQTVGQYPAVHGWDLGKRLDHEMNIDSVNFENMRKWIMAAYKRGGVNTVSWHLDNLTSGGDSWDRTSSVSDILPGGSKHSDFNNQLDLLADFFKSVSKAPIVFRPWHEHNGSWFWWGKNNCTEQEYIQLYRYTVTYLRDQKKVHNLLYAFSPDRSAWNIDGNDAKTNYFYGYPGDDYVDVIGLDDYADVGRLGGPHSAQEQADYYEKALILISEIADEKDKVAALTETGLEGITNPKWFTEVLYKPIQENTRDIRLAWVLVWRNSTTKHHYAPYPGHPSVPDFVEFESIHQTIFEKDLKKLMYKKPLKNLK